MSQVQAISGATGDDLQKLTDLAKEMGAKTKFSASEAAEGYQYMAMAGWKTEDMLSGLPGIMNLAAASGESLGTTSDIVTDALTAMGLQAGDSAHFADVLAAASSNSNTNVSMMGETFKYAAPLAGALGYNIEDLAQAVGLMANSGIKGTQAGTSLRSILTRLADPPKDCAAAMEKYNISMTNSDGSMKSLMEVMENMRDSLGDLDDQEQAAAASAIGGQEAMSGLLAIVNASEGDFAKLSSAIDNADGSAERMAEVMQDNLQGKITILKSALEGVGIAAFEKFQQPLEDAVDNVTEAVSNFDLDAFLQKMQDILAYAQQFAPVVAAIGGAIAGLYASIKAMQFAESLKKLATSVQAFFALIAANPLIVVVSVIASIAAALITLYNTNEEFRNAVQPFLTSVVQMMQNIWAQIQAFGEWLQPYVQAVITFIVTTVQSIITTVTPVVQSISEAFSAAFQLIQTVWSGLEPLFGGIMGVVMAVVQTAASIIGNAFQLAWSLVSAVWSVATSYFSAIFNTIAGIFAVIDDVLHGDFSSAWEAIKGVLSGWGEFFQGLFDDIGDVFSAIGDFFVGIGTDIVQGLKDGINAAWGGFKSFVKGLWNGIKGIFHISADDVSVEGGSVNGSHAGGLDYVPYNNYVANLHRGEMVLTAKEADSYRKGEKNAAVGCVTVIQNIYSQAKTAAELMREAQYEQRRALMMGAI